MSDLTQSLSKITEALSKITEALSKITEALSKTTQGCSKEGVCNKALQPTLLGMLDCGKYIEDVLGNRCQVDGYVDVPNRLAVIKV